MMTRRCLILTGLLLAALFLAACGGDAQEKEGASSTEAEAETKEAKPALIGTTPGRAALVEFYATW